MNLIDVNVIGPKPPQRFFDLLHDTGTAGIARYLSTVPLQSGLGGNKYVRAQPSFGDCFAYDLLGTAETVNGRRVDNIDTVLECGPDGDDGLGLVGSSPHPPANSPGSYGDGRYFERGARNVPEFEVPFKSFRLMSHDTILSLC